MKCIHTIVTHSKPHLDEIVAIWLLIIFGEKMFPGVNTAKIVFWDTGGETPDGRSPEEWEKDGYLLIGIGGGILDEHPSLQNSGRKEDECAATLVAKVLGIAKEPALQKILRYTLKTDLKGSGQKFDLQHLVKLGYRGADPDDSKKVMRWTFTALNWMYDEQNRFFAAVKEYQEKAQTVEVIGPQRKRLPIVAIQSDNPEINKVARNRDYGCRAALVIQQRSSGHVLIFGNKQYGRWLNLNDLMAMIRVEEQRAADKMVTTDWNELRQEGRVAGAECWWYHKIALWIMNGSESARDVLETKLSLEKILKLAKTALDPDAFQPDFAPMCRKGTCKATRKTPCSYYAYGLQRCRDNRRQDWEAKRRG
jgi:hypothetical protein